MAQVKFFHKLAKPIPAIIGMGAPKRSGDNQSIPIKFRIALDGNNVRSAPQFVQSAYKEIQNGADEVSLKKELENIDVDIFNLPENKRPNFRLPRLYLQDLVVTEAKNSEGDVATVLSFKTIYPWDKAIWEYLGDHYSTTVFLKFDSAQGSLLDESEKDEEEPAQADLPEEGEEEEAEPLEAA